MIGIGPTELVIIGLVCLVVPLAVIGMVMLFFIYMTTLFYGLFVMRGVIEEKQSFPQQLNLNN